MRETDAWTDIFESQKRVISNSNASKPGGLRSKEIPVKDQELPHIGDKDPN